MSKPTIYEVEGKKYALIDGKLIPVDSESDTKKEKQEKKSNVKPVSYLEVPNIIHKMSQKDIKIFGDILANNENEAYNIKIDDFVKKYNITPPKNKTSIHINRALRHEIMIKALEGKTQKEFNAQKSKCLKFLQMRLSRIPQDTTSVKDIKMREYNLQEIARWEHEPTTKK